METQQQQKRDYEITVFLSPNQEMVVYLNDKTKEELDEFVDKTMTRHPEANMMINQKKNTFLNNNGN